MLVIQRETKLHDKTQSMIKPSGTDVITEKELELECLKYTGFNTNS